MRLSAALSVYISFLLCCVYKIVGAKMIELDWSTRSSLFDNGYHTTTVFARLNDLLRFRCSGELSFQIHLMNPLDALSCTVTSTSPKNMHLVGFCGPKTSDPRLALRPFALVPGQPTFQVNEIYYFVAVGNNSRQDYSSELCDTYGMRIRLHVMAKNAEIALDKVEEETRMLLAREQQKADTELVREYNRNLQLEQQRLGLQVTNSAHLTVDDSYNRASHEDNQSIRDKHTRRKGQSQPMHLIDYDRTGRGRLNTIPHGSEDRQLVMHKAGNVDDATYHFRPIASDPYSLPSRTIGYDFVIGYEDTNASTRWYRTKTIILTYATFLFLLLRRI